MNFWIPQKGNKILYNNKEYEIEEILQEDSIPSSQIKVKKLNKILWLQDVAWKPTIEDLDSIVILNGGEVLNDTICLPSPLGKKCYFTRPDNVEMYEKILKDIRVYNLMHGNNNK